ncbi:MAG: NAD-dependent epimerase/dehydratase family protein [Bifidobacteriaceae bacterium]|jgi:nucleoside-diphosphate-sugar epimerase|nr:NAD-dependent epimerase/dehydratase family protein [Bifidobacteriaceae bacterium]
MSKSVLFLGGTGIISWSCVNQAIASGWQVSVLNRGQSTLRPVPPAAELIRCDARDQAAARSALAGRHFDVVADFIDFTPDQLAGNVELLKGHTDQFIFIATAAAYQRGSRLPITESTPLVNPWWQYSRDKIACEDYLTGLIRTEGFPATIVRPAHTYDAGLLPCLGGWTDIARLRAGQPVVVQGDGTSLWVLTHARDFAYCFVGLFGQSSAIGDTFHIMGDEVLTWNQIYTELAHAAGVKDPVLAHVTSEAIAAELPAEGPGLIGDRTHSVIFDCSKVRAIATGFHQQVPFCQGAKEIIACFDAHPELQVVRPDYDAAFDRLVERAVIDWGPR